MIFHKIIEDVVPMVRSYLWIYLFEVRVILVDLEVDFGGRYGHRPVNRNTRWHQDRRGADVDRAWNYVIDLKKKNELWVVNLLFLKAKHYKFLRN